MVEARIQSHVKVMRLRRRRSLGKESQLMSSIVNVNINQGDPHAISVHCNVIARGATEHRFPRNELRTGGHMDFTIGTMDDAKSDVPIVHTLEIQRVSNYGDNIYLTCKKGGPLVLDLDNREAVMTIAPGEEVKLPHGQYRHIVVREQSASE